MLRTLAFLGLGVLAVRQFTKHGLGTDGGGDGPQDRGRGMASTEGRTVPIGGVPERHAVGSSAGHLPSAADNPAAGQSGHVPTDLSGDDRPGADRPVDEHYRPDPHAAVAPEDRESLRPVTMPAPKPPPGG